MIDIHVSYVGTIEKTPNIQWPEDWPAPRVGDSIDVSILGLPEVTTVRVVEWYPHGADGDPTPFVYVVVGPSRP